MSNIAAATTIVHQTGDWRQPEVQKPLGFFFLVFKRKWVKKTRPRSAPPVIAYSPCEECKRAIFDCTDRKNEVILPQDALVRLEPAQRPKILLRGNCVACMRCSDLCYASQLQQEYLEGFSVEKSPQLERYAALVTNLSRLQSSARMLSPSPLNDFFFACCDVLDFYLHFTGAMLRLNLV